jgi:hypothetical protein
MPFAPEFDDVYSTIKASVQEAFGEPGSRCFRLDESRPAGRITDRLLDELRSSSLCIADLTGSRPNVMWEVGFAMALEKPIVVITQVPSELPFDIKDMQNIHYDRNHLSHTLGKPLKTSIIDTIQLVTPRPPKSEGQDDRLVGQLMVQVKDLKSMLSQVVKAWSPSTIDSPSGSTISPTLSNLQGSWIDRSSRSYLYAQLIDNDLLIPYCYSGNSDLTGFFYGWKRMGEYWFARYCWMDGQFSGFAFLKQDSIDELNGAWWYSEDVEKIPERPIQGSGEVSHWQRADLGFPDWATRFLEDAEREGLATLLRRKH